MHPHIWYKRPDNQPLKLPQMKTVLLGVLLFFVVAIGGKMAATKMRENKIADTQKQEQAARLVKITAQRANVLKALKDPASAQWQNEVLSPDQSTQCGEVNAKNSMGGYVGFKRYISNHTGYLIQGGNFGTWSMTDNRIPVPDYMVKGAQMSDAGDQITFARDVFNFFWQSNCS